MEVITIVDWIGVMDGMNRRLEKREDLENYRKALQEELEDTEKELADLSKDNKVSAWPIAQQQRPDRNFYQL